MHLDNSFTILQYKRNIGSIFDWLFMYRTLKQIYKSTKLVASINKKHKKIYNLVNKESRYFHNRMI